MGLPAAAAVAKAWECLGEDAAPGGLKVQAAAILAEIVTERPALGQSVRRHPMADNVHHAGGNPGVTIGLAEVMAEVAALRAAVVQAKL